MSLAKWVELTVCFVGASDFIQKAAETGREMAGRGNIKVGLAEHEAVECQGIPNFIYRLFLTL